MDTKLILKINGCDRQLVKLNEQKGSFEVALYKVTPIYKPDLIQTVQITSCINAKIIEYYLTPNDLECSVSARLAPVYIDSRTEFDKLLKFLKEHEWKTFKPQNPN